MRAVAAAAASACRLQPPTSWPVVADGVAEVLAGREFDDVTLEIVAGVLPPVAGHLSPERAASLSWTKVGPDALGYAELAGLDVDAFPARPLARRTWWTAILQARTPTGHRLPPLAGLRSLALLAAGSRATDDQAIYLLPYRRSNDHTTDQLLRAIRNAVGDEALWYAAAQLTRALPYLDQAGRRAVITELDGFSETWEPHLRTMLEGDTTLPGSGALAWGSNARELAASHPAAALDALASRCDPSELADLCATAVERIATEYGLSHEWQVDDRPLPVPVDGDTQHLAGSFESHRSLGFDEKPQARDCVVNTFVAAVGDDIPVLDEPLALGTDYEVLCNLGQADPRSLLGGEGANFPLDLLPHLDVELLVVLMMDGQMIAHEPLSLSADRPDTDWVRLRLPRRTSPCVSHGHLAIYFEYAAIHVQALTLPFGGPRGESGPSSGRLFSISRSLSDLRKVSDRSGSLMLAGSSVVVNGLDFAPMAFSAEPSKIDTAIAQARYQLYRIHFRTVTEGEKRVEHTRYSTRGTLNAKSAQEFDMDLRRLAGQGFLLYDTLFHQNSVARGMRDMLRREAQAYGRAPMLQVVELPGQLRSAPWALVYDLPMGGDPADYVPCRSVAEFGPGGDGRLPPPVCPYEDDHRNDSRWRSNQLCPWGFWGLSSVIEQPPHVDRDLEACVWSRPGRPDVLMVADPALDQAVSTAHASELGARLGVLHRPVVAGKHGLRDELARESMDVVYVYCHLSYRETSPSTAAFSAMRLGVESVAPTDIVAWSASDWPEPHWPARHPLVIINGCHSVEFSSGTLGNFVDAFANRAGASGVLGTEISIDQRVGAWAMELFLTELKTRSVGDALRSTRWQMLSRGNLMGLAYTPYCLASLRLREHEENP